MPLQQVPRNDHLDGIDTRSYLKLLLLEPESAAVQAAVALEPYVIISTLAEREAESQLRAELFGGGLTKREHQRTLVKMQAMLTYDPFEQRPLAGFVFVTALAQLRRAPQIHCRSLDRLHLAAMEGMGLRRLKTHDAKP